LTASFLDDNNSHVRIIRTKSPGRQGNEVSNWSSDFEKLCRSRGIRVTPQRLAVYRALSEDLAHPTAESVYKRVSKQLPGLSQATIYRALQFLESESLIRRVSSPGAIGRYDANVGPHQHLLCRVCGSLQDISVPALHSAVIPRVSGFTVEELDIRLVGLCEACSSSESKPQKRGVGHSSKQTLDTNSKERKLKHG
jgi:Fur family transcriptional regulator, peroxide stress response regulator